MMFETVALLIVALSFGGDILIQPVVNPSLRIKTLRLGRMERFAIGSGGVFANSGFFLDMLFIGISHILKVGHLDNLVDIAGFKSGLNAFKFVYFLVGNIFFGFQFVRTEFKRTFDFCPGSLRLDEML